VPGTWADCTSVAGPVEQTALGEAGVLAIGLGRSDEPKHQAGTPCGQLGADSGQDHPRRLRSQPFRRLGGLASDAGMGSRAGRWGATDAGAGLSSTEGERSLQNWTT